MPAVSVRFNQENIEWSKYLNRRTIVPGTDCPGEGKLWRQTGDWGIWELRTAENPWATGTTSMDVLMLEPRGQGLPPATASAEAECSNGLPGRFRIPRGDAAVIREPAWGRECEKGMAQFPPLPSVSCSPSRATQKETPWLQNLDSPGLDGNLSVTQGTGREGIWGQTGKPTTRMDETPHKVLRAPPAQITENQNTLWAWSLENPSAGGSEGKGVQVAATMGPEYKQYWGKQQVFWSGSEGCVLGRRVQWGCKEGAWKVWIPVQAHWASSCSEGNGNWIGPEQRVVWFKLCIRNITLIKAWGVDRRETARPGICN